MMSSTAKRRIEETPTAYDRWEGYFNSVPDYFEA